MAMARARDTRLRIPPESSAGIRSLHIDHPDELEFFDGVALDLLIGKTGVPVQAESHIFPNSHGIEEGVALKEHAEFARQVIPLLLS